MINAYILKRGVWGCLGEMQSFGEDIDVWTVYAYGSSKTSAVVCIIGEDDIQTRSPVIFEAYVIVI